MATHTSLPSLFSDIADAIRGKTDESGLLIADDFPSAISNISSKLSVYTGSYTPSSNTNRPGLNYPSQWGTHTKMPVFLAVFDPTNSITTNCALSWVFYDYTQINSTGFPYSSSLRRYGGVVAYSRASSDPTIYNKLFEYASTNTGDGSAEYPRYWATETGFHPWSGNSSRNWRSGRTYKIIGAWLP